MPGTIRDDTARLLAARGLTEAELRQRLARLGHPSMDIDRAVREAREARWIDDAALARAAVRGGLGKGRGRERLLAHLVARGIAPELAERAWDDLLASGEADPEGALRSEVERRVRAQGGALTGTAATRIYNALLRSGHDPESVKSALAPYLPASLGDEDDFP